MPIRVTPSNLALVSLFWCAAIPLMAPLLYAFFRLVFGTLYPAYASFKAVKTKNVKEYVKWMMYWIVFAFFTCAETFTDIILAFWFPFYYEIKIILVIWLLSPATKGSSILYRKFVHPQLAKREKEIDEYISRSTQQGYSTVLQMGMGGLNFASNFLMQTALRGGGTLVDQLRRSYSLSDLAFEAPDVRSPPRPNNNVIEKTIEQRITEETDTVDLTTHSDDDDSGTDTGDGPTFSSGYSSTSAASTKVPPPLKTEVAIISKTRSSGSTTVAKNSGETRKRTVRKRESADSPTYATLPRVTKRTRKKIT